MSDDKTTPTRTLLYVTLALIAIVVSLALYPSCTIEGISLSDKEYIHIPGTDMYNVYGQRPEKFAQIFVVPYTFGENDRITTIRDYYLARLNYDIALLKNKLGEIDTIDENLRLRRDLTDAVAVDAYHSLRSDNATISLRTDSEGRFSTRVSPGRYFVLIQSNRINRDTKTEALGELAYKTDVWLLPFQTFRFEKVWPSKD